MRFWNTIRATLIVLLAVTASVPTTATNWIINANTTYGILCDGSDETKKIAQAFAESKGLLIFGEGVCGINGLPTITTHANFRGAGREKTVFKNLSATLPGLVFAFHSSGSTSWITFGDFTLDQNGSTGEGIRVQSQYAAGERINVKNQAGNSFAFIIDRATLSKFSNITLNKVSNGLHIKTAHYVGLDQVNVERTTGVGILIENAKTGDFNHLYLDSEHVNTGTVGELLKVVGGGSLQFNTLSAEIASNAGTPSLSYFLFQDSENININGGRINHYAMGSPSMYAFWASGSDLTIRGVDWITLRSAQIFAGVSASNRAISLEHIRSHVSTTGSSHGLGAWSDTPTGRTRIIDWIDRGPGTLPTHYIRSNDIMCQQVNSSVYVMPGSGIRTFLNCPNIIQ